MFKLIKSKIGIKTALLTNVVLFLIILAGGWVLVELQCNRLEAKLFERGRQESIYGATTISNLLEETVDNKIFTMKELFDTNYKQIPGFDPPKYHTKYDEYYDKAAIKLLDVFLQNKDNIYSATMDVNGYCPTHNSIYQKKITGDYETDKAGNRTKRIYNDPVGRKAALNLKPGFRQIYFRDTGMEIWDISSPVMVHGKHWGSFRIGITLKTIAEAKKNLIFSLSIVFISILLVSMLSVFLIVNFYVKPLDKLKESALAIANGKINEPLKIKSSDEVGQVAEAIERLRISLRHAMKIIQKRKKAA